MIAYTNENFMRWSKLGAKKVFFTAAEAIVQKHDNAVFLSADVGRRFGLDAFTAIDPGRYVDVGISEQAMIGVAAGYAAEGFLPYAVAYAPFVSARVLDQVRVVCGAMNSNLIIAGADAGFSAADLGPALTALSDVANMRAIPNMTVIEPADCAEIVKALIAAAELTGPAYIRIVGGPNQPMLHRTDFEFEIGRARVERDGNDFAIIASGPIVLVALAAAERLKADGISAQVINMHTVKPLDTGMLDALTHFSAIATVEEHGAIGGLGGAVAEYYADKVRRPRQLSISAGDRFYPADTRKNTLARAGLDAESIAKRVRAFL